MSTSANRAQATRIDADTAIGTVRLTVTDLDRSREFYERAIGLQVTGHVGETLALGVEGAAALIELQGDRSAQRLDHGATGLFHLAILLPTRRDLAFALRRLAEARQPLGGASDHLVSEALYLADPDGNGIEIYRDRPYDQWPRAGDTLEMATLPLDLRDVLGEAPVGAEPNPLAPSGTRIGHVHLQVADLAAAEAFYSGVLGFDVTVRGYPGALFFSAGGYHHHIGVNTWHSRDASAPRRGSVGLRSFAIELPGQAALETVLDRVRTAGIELHGDASGALVRDPSGNGVRLRARGSSASG
jgi:catechol 2,3-dioxygenase